jgi:hypothetical protein
VSDDGGGGPGGGEGRGQPGGSGPDERMVLAPPLALLLGLVVGVFLGATGYVSNLPVLHHSVAFAGLEGLIAGAVVGGTAGTRGLKLSERRARPARGGGGRRPRR